MRGAIHVLEAQREVAVLPGSLFPAQEVSVFRAEGVAGSIDTDFSRNEESNDDLVLSAEEFVPTDACRTDPRRHP